jgi:hypothetical protein
MSWNENESRLLVASPNAADVKKVEHNDFQLARIEVYIRT